jgi:hypothetical protein
MAMNALFSDNTEAKNNPSFYRIKRNISGVFQTLFSAEEQ